MCDYAFDQHAAILLGACGYTEERVEAFWEDVGGPESGPKLSGHDAHGFWTTKEDKIGNDRYLIVQRGRVVEYGPLWDTGLTGESIPF